MHLFPTWEVDAPQPRNGSAGEDWLHIPNIDASRRWEVSYPGKGSARLRTIHWKAQVGRVRFDIIRSIHLQGVAHASGYPIASLGSR
jgi:hypothetical protein